MNEPTAKQSIGQETKASSLTEASQQAVSQPTPQPAAPGETLVVNNQLNQPLTSIESGFSTGQSVVSPQPQPLPRRPESVILASEQLIRTISRSSLRSAIPNRQLSQLTELLNDYQRNNAPQTTHR